RGQGAVAGARHRAAAGTHGRVVADRTGRLRRGAAGVDRVLGVGGAGERARREGGHFHRTVGMPEHHLQRPRRGDQGGTGARPVRVLPLYRGQRGHVRRAGRLHHEPRRRLPVPAARPRVGASGHDGAPAALARRRTGRLARVGERAALGGRARLLSAHLSGCVRRAVGGRVHPARPAVPPIGVPVGAAGRGLPARTGAAAGRLARPAQRGAAAARPGAPRTRAPAAGNAARGPGAAAVVVAAALPRGHRGGGHAVLPRRAVGDVDRRAQARGAGDGARRRPGRAGDPMSRRLRVAHTTGFTYESAVTGSFNEARLTPRSDARQNVIVNRVDTVPPTRPFRYTDYWGT